MPARMIALVLLILFTAASSSSAQPLTLGSTRAEVMKIVYRDGAHADTLRRGSAEIEQIRMYPDTGYKRNYVEAIRIAPVRMFGMDTRRSFSTRAGVFTPTAGCAEA